MVPEIIIGSPGSSSETNLSLEGNLVVSAFVFEILGLLECPQLVMESVRGSKKANNALYMGMLFKIAHNGMGIYASVAFPIPSFLVKDR